MLWTRAEGDILAALNPIAVVHLLIVKSCTRNHQYCLGLNHTHSSQPNFNQVRRHKRHQLWLRDRFHSPLDPFIASVRFMLYQIGISAPLLTKGQAVHSLGSKAKAAYS